MTQPIAKRFPTPSIDELPDDIRTRLLAVQEKSGFVPNVFLTIGQRQEYVRNEAGFLLHREQAGTDIVRQLVDRGGWKALCDWLGHGQVRARAASCGWSGR